VIQFRYGDALPAVSVEDDDAGTVALDPAYVLPRLMAARAATAPERPFLAEVTGRRASYGETWAGVRRWTSWLGELGIARDDRVVSMLPASIDAVILWLAAGCAGALEVPVDPALRGVFLRHVLADSGARVCLARPEHAALVADSGVGGLEIVIVDRDGCPADHAVLADGLQFPAPGDPSCVIYTSGTTGLPKGVVISWAQMTASIGRTPLLVMSDVGGRVVLRERFSASAFLADVRAGECTSTTAYVPLVLATPERDDDADNPLRLVWGGGSLPLSARFGKRFGTQLMLLEYLNQPATTAAATAGGWYRTGDAVVRHADGTFTFVDRMRDTIRRNGENISSTAIETVISNDPRSANARSSGYPTR
jgi:carnitine-CoA ligase